MKVVLYMAVAANGIVAMGQAGTPWGKASWDNFANATAEAGTLVIGRTTYEAMDGDGMFEKLEGKPKVIVVSGSAGNLPKATTASSPQAALELLQGYEIALVGGGPTLATAFLSQNLLDEINLNVEPVLIGKGLELITEKLERRLKLVSIDNYGTGVNLKYQVGKANE